MGVGDPWQTSISVRIKQLQTCDWYANELTNVFTLTKYIDGVEPRALRLLFGARTEGFKHRCTPREHENPPWAKRRRSALCDPDAIESHPTYGLHS